MKEQILNNLEYFGLFIGIMLLTILVAYLVGRFFKRLIRLSTEIMKNDPTNYQFLRHAVVGIVYIVGTSIAIYSIPALRTLANSMLAGAGILAVAVGFASQHALSNIISGVFIVIFKPFRINDRLQIGTNTGIVEDITLRHTVIRNFENKRILIPNAKISDEVIINSDFGDDKICKWVDVGISYESDLKKAKAIIQEEILNHPLIIDGRSEEEKKEGAEIVAVRVIMLGESSVNLRGWAWTKNSADGFVLYCEVIESIKLRFDEAGIEIPYPQRTISYKKAPTDK